MEARELIKFLKLLHFSGALSPYWKGRVADTVRKMGGTL